MERKEIAPGWFLLEWTDFTPSMEGPSDVAIEIDKDGDIEVSGIEDYTSHVYIPVAAVKAIVEAAERYFKRKDDR